jgi:hypothetical protein
MENVMNLPKRSKKNRSKVNGERFNGLDPDKPLSPLQAAAYVEEHGVPCTYDVLMWQRRLGRKIPAFTKSRGRVSYTPRTLEPFIEARLSYMADPTRDRRFRQKVTS